MHKMIKTVAATSAAVLLLSSCHGIGGGTSPQSLKIVQITPATVLTEAFIRGEQQPGQAYTCVRSLVQAYIFFDDDSVGNFTRRVKWVSSDPSVVTVSNFDEVVPNNPTNRFDYGSLAPLAPGTATITATYLDMTATIPITVDTAGAITITPSDMRLVPKSFQSLRASAMLGGKMVDLTTQTQFSLDGEDDDDDLPDATDPTDLDNYATLSDTGALAAVAASAPLTARGVLNVVGGACATSPAARSSATLQVVDIPTAPSPNPLKLGLSLEPEDGYTTTFAEGTSQFLKLIARFGDFNGDGDADDPNEFQDLSFLPLAPAFTSSNTDDVNFIGSSLLGRGSLVYGTQDVEDVGVARADGTSNLSAIFGAAPSLTPPDPGVASTVLPVIIRDLPLRTIEIKSSAERDPADGLCTVADTFGPVPSTLTTGKFICLRAIGTFGLGATPSGTDFVQDITKDVVWTTLGTATLNIANGRVVGAGLATGSSVLQTEGTCANLEVCPETITASFSSTQRDPADNVAKVVTITQTANINVQQPAATP